MSQIPHLLTPYTSLASEGSLTLLTSVLGCSTNWLLLRYLQSYLRTAAAHENDEEVSVLLVSFLRDAVFWREGSRKLGLDLDKLAMKKRFQYIDGLSSLFLAPPSRNTQADQNIMVGSDLAGIGANIKNGIQTLRAGGKKVVLVIDQIDLLLATNSGSDGISAESIGDMLMELRQDAHNTILSLAADTPLVTAQSTPLETNHANFLLSTAHQAELVMGLRLLDTGAARDVSGVCRISVNQDDDDDGPKLDDKELLYFVGADSSVRVFERGT